MGKFLRTYYIDNHQGKTLALCSFLCSFHYFSLCILAVKEGIGVTS